MKIIRIIVLTILSSFALQAYAQRCATPVINLEAIQQNDPARYKRIMQMEQQLAAFTSRQSTSDSNEVIVSECHRRKTSKDFKTCFSYTTKLPYLFYITVNIQKFELWKN